MEDTDSTRLGGDNPAEQKASSSGEPGPAESEGQSEATANKRLAPARGPKRRTKTGCLTCRKRRIKCGEEKPRCNNCIKAKRECEGYTQRVIFKNALGPFGATYDPGVPANLQTPATLFPQQQQLQHQHQPGQPITGQAINPQQRLLAPRPPTIPSAPSLTRATHQHAEKLWYYSSDSHRTDSRPEEIVNQHSSALPVNDFISPGQPWPNMDQAAYLALPSEESSFLQHDYAPTIPPHPITGIDAINQSLPDYEVVDRHPVLTSQLERGVPPLAETIGFYNEDTFQQAQAYYSWDAEEEALLPTAYAPDEQEDDYYDVDSDDELQDVTEEEGYNQLNLIMASVQQDAIRSLNTYLNEPNILASYQPSMGSSPLNNPKTARIWVHFMHATGPSLSIWERHNTFPTNFFGGPVPVSQQGLWNYVMPVKALEHPALLQAILAISSLHIAKLQQNHFTITFKHYQYALRKISKAVGLPLRRKQVATLAATLLLAFYEVTAAEHSKWDRHVAGAAQLLKEIDFAGITRDLRAYRRSVRSQKDGWSGSNDPYLPYNLAEDDPFADKELEVDANVVSRITGRAIDYDRIGHVDIYPRKRRLFTRKDIENFRLQCDLYWWYCKQDLFQSMISGNRLHTPFDRWNVCPPRARLGKLDAIYGSFDHLVLLLARMIDFGYRDRKRKLRSLEASGSDWRPNPAFFRFLGRFTPRPEGESRGPPPGMPMGPPTSRGPPRGNNPQPPTQTTEYKPMYGMMPAGSPSPAPAAFITMGESPPYSGSVDEDEDTTPDEAEAEWESILAGYHFYESQLGQAFAPLPVDSTTPVSSPFGPAIQYRSGTIAILWAYYYTGRIMLHRLHPCMPPATMVAAGAAASTTAQFAQTIGKITAGIYYPQIYIQEVGSLNPNLGSVWIEATVNLFVAGVQFTDATQRHWTVATLRSVSRLAGWQSAESIASGCEAAWVNTARAGRGPPYTRTPGFPAAEEPISSRGNMADEYITPIPSNERRFVKVERTARARWAMGLLELESDLVGLNIDEPP